MKECSYCNAELFEDIEPKGDRYVWYWICEECGYHSHEPHLIQTEEQFIDYLEKYKPAIKNTVLQEIKKTKSFVKR